jgi:hypothetical protein
MINDESSSCVEPAAGPLDSSGPLRNATTENNEGGRGMDLLVGNEAPDFEAMAYHSGGFKTVKLSEFRGKWVLLCFYPGDFTFV